MNIKKYIARQNDETKTVNVKTPCKISGLSFVHPDKNLWHRHCFSTM